MARYFIVRFKCQMTVTKQSLFGLKCIRLVIYGLPHLKCITKVITTIFGNKFGNFQNRDRQRRKRGRWRWRKERWRRRDHRKDGRSPRWRKKNWRCRGRRQDGRNENPRSRNARQRCGLWRTRLFPPYSRPITRR